MEYTTTDYVLETADVETGPTPYELALPPIEWPATDADRAVNEGMWQRECINDYYNY